MKEETRLETGVQPLNECGKKSSHEVEKHTIRSWRHGFEQWYVIDFHPLARTKREQERERQSLFTQASSLPPPRNSGVESAEHRDENRFSLRHRRVSKQGGRICVGQMVARAAFATNRCETCTLVHDSLKFSKFPVRPPVCSRCSAAKSRFGMLLEMGGMIFNNN